MRKSGVRLIVRTATAHTLQKLRSAFETAGVIFIDENGQGPGVRLRKTAPDAGKRPDQLATENHG